MDLHTSMGNVQNMMTPQAILKETFGYDTFRPLQREIIENVLARRDTLAVMPTGGGKSLCYQIPALMFEGLTVVVSPLIALMKDQVEQLRAAGVPAVFLNSSLQQWEYQENIEQVRSGLAKLLYVAPETLVTPRLFALLSEMRVDCLTIDEAHCISEWGHDFRPEYRQLSDVRRRFPDATCLALTATATARVRSDIQSNLGFTHPNQHIASFNRENLFIEVSAKDSPADQAIRFLDRFKDQSGIIYCFSRRQVDDLAALLARRGYSVRPYHAGLEDDERRRNQEAFIRDDAQIIVATVAFGMGINKPNVRFVMHYDLPKSIEGYYQEIGRAGRDGLPAHCLLLYSYSDVAKLRYFVDQKEGMEKQVAIQHLNAMVSYAEDETNCRRKPLLNYFDEPYDDQNCGNCDNCTSETVLTDITIPAQKFLSCVKRTGERFGAVHVTRVLLGSLDQRILQAGHNQLSTYGIGKELDRKQWSHLANQLLHMGYLEQDREYRSLKLTSKGWVALKNRTPIMGRVSEPRKLKTKERQSANLDYDQALFARLRALRKELADDAGVPPYVIFSDRSLVEMAAYYPQSKERLLAINGVGQVKAQHYGDPFLAIIREYCDEHGIAERQKDIQGYKEISRPKSTSGQRHTLIGEAFNDGESIQSLMSRYNVKLTTIVDHLSRYAADGHKLRSDDALLSPLSASPDQQAAALAAFDELGTDLLKPVFDKLEGQVNYEDLRILRLYYVGKSQ